MLWLDDVRDPTFFCKPLFNQDYKTQKYIWATSVEQAQYFVEIFGPPVFMVLDHDLGFSIEAQRDRDTMEFLKWLSTKHFDWCPSFKTITANPVGQKNIESFMEGWQRAIYNGF